MQYKTYFLPLFFLCLGVVFFLLLLGRFGLLSFVENSVQDVFFPLSIMVRSHTVLPQSSKLQALETENARLQEKITALSQLQGDNQALRDQFQTTTPAPTQLLPATVVGMDSAIPNISFPQSLIVNKGSSDGVTVGMPLVLKNELLGSITQTSSHFAKVLLITSGQTSLSVRDQTTGALGVAKGQGNGEILVGNIVLSDTIHVGDTIVTLGSQTLSGNGIMPGLILGKVISVDKEPSSLFQTAEVVPFTAFDHLMNVFILIH